MTPKEKIEIKQWIRQYMKKWKPSGYISPYRAACYAFEALELHLDRKIDLKDRRKKRTTRQDSLIIK